MKRKAKKSLEIQDLIEKCLDQTSFDEVPKTVCPLYKFPDIMPATFCCTKCYDPCDNFIEFSFITDECLNLGCNIKSPCYECRQSIEDFKYLMKLLKSAFDKRMRPKRLKARILNYCKKNNKKYTALKKARERRHED